ncbi:MAG: DNA repair protein RadC [Eubacteriales bacterium]
MSKRIATSSARKNLKVTEPRLLADYFMERMRHLEKEVVYLILLDAKNHMISEQIVSTGTVTMSLISTREIFKVALSYQAVSIILLHNHPSGDPEPSKQDLNITKKIFEVGVLLDIPLLDHIIIGDHVYYSLKEHKLF